jgi:hypothetical protein
LPAADPVASRFSIQTTGVALKAVKLEWIELLPPRAD